MRYTKLAVLALLSFVLTSTYLMAQSASTSLRGVVTDPTGAAIPNASVHLTEDATNAAADATTNGSGEYSFQQLKPGDYTITVSAGSFGTQILKARLLVAQPGTVNAKLSLSKETVVVDVTTTSQTINTTDASLGNALDRETIDALPSVGRHIETLLSLQPGVSYIGDSTDSTESRNGVVAGARSDQTNLTLDGIDNNDQIFPAAFTGALRTPIDSVEEFRVTTSNANVDQGRSSGGQANIITRSGTNDLHGSLYEYNRTNFGDANSWFNKQAELSVGDPNVPDKLILNTYGTSLGGPILKDKLFYFANFEGQRETQGIPTQRTVPGLDLRNGIIHYENDSNGISTLNPSDIAAIDYPGAMPNPGVNPAALALIDSYQLPRGANLSADSLNLATLNFSGSQPSTLETYVTRIDYTPTEKHRIFIRGTLMNDITDDSPYYPGQGPSAITSNDSKGIAAGDTYAITANLINSLRYGYTRQSYAQVGAAHGAYATFRNIDSPESTFRNSQTFVPVHNVTDDLSWTKGRHTIQAGINWRHFDYINTNDFNSWDSSLANAAYLAGAEIAGTGGYLDPGDVDVDDYGTNYDNAAAALTGLMSQTTNQANYVISSDGKTGTLLGQGAPLHRDYRTNEFEWYLQDVWKARPDLTITLGVRHTVLQTPWEVNGQQAQPSISLHDWFATRAAQAKLGNTVQPDISFTSSGKAHNGASFYPMNWLNFAPRIALAYSPSFSNGFLQKLTGGAGKSSVRAGFGIYYDHFGQGIVQNFSSYGSFGLDSSLTSPPGTLDVTDAPRFTGLHDIPTGQNPTQPSTINYPFQYPQNAFAITYGLDDRLKTPYNEVVDFSVQRELKGGFTVETSFVGRYGRHLLQERDLASPLDLVDPVSGMDYYSAVTALDKLYDAGVNSGASIAPIPYFEDEFPDAAGLDEYGDGALGNSATTNFYNDLFLGQGDPTQSLNGIESRGNETNVLFNADLFCYPGCGSGEFRYFQDQFSSLYAWSSIGTSSYNAGQITLRHPMKHGVEFELSYTLSKSIDIGSDTESNSTSTPVANGFSNFGPLLDAFNPKKSRGLSDFDTKHLFNADWVIDLPFGRGKTFANNISPLVDSVIGGWELTGIARLSSGLPFSANDGKGWSTNWQFTSNMVRTGPIKTHRHIDANGNEQVFDNPTTALNNLRLPYAGEAGERNEFRGDGYFSVDMGLHKSIPIYNKLHLDLAWETFNISNSVRFDAHTLNVQSTEGSQFGTYTGTYTAPRQMQFSARLEF